jgi:hypothetical protein
MIPMKNKLNLFYLIVLTILISSCSSNDKPIGQWSDNIKLSVKDVVFKSTADSITIKTEGDWWWITDISVDNTNFSNFEGVNLLSDHYVIKQDCFVIERRDKNTLFIKLDKNTASVERVVFIGLEAGDYFDRVKITQAPK